MLVTPGVFGKPQAIDCVAAHVNRRAVTLTDVRILREFGIGEEAAPGSAPATPESVLGRAVDRLLVVDLMRGNFPVPGEELDARLAGLKGRFEPADWQRRLTEFGIAESGIRSYLESLLQYERMVAVRFGQPPEVGPEEIQNAYDREFAPARAAAGLEPLPLDRVRGEIEETLKARKRQAQISDWIQGLRGQAEVSFHDECLASLK